MVPFWVLIIIRHHYYFGYPKRDYNFDNYPYGVVWGLRCRASWGGVEALGFEFIVVWGCLWCIGHEPPEPLAFLCALFVGRGGADTLSIDPGSGQCYSIRLLSITLSIRYPTNLF